MAVAEPPTEGGPVSSDRHDATSPRLQHTIAKCPAPPVPAAEADEAEGEDEWGSAARVQRALSVSAKGLPHLLPSATM
jgi:hypothetical protein